MEDLRSSIFVYCLTMKTYVVLKEVTRWHWGLENGRYFDTERDAFAFKTKEDTIDFCNSIVKEAKENISKLNEIPKSKIKVKRSRPGKDGRILWSVFPLPPFDATLDYDLIIFETELK